MRSDCLPGGFDPSETDPARNDGGPAFPFVEPAGPGVSVTPGMSLRHHLAGKALAGFCANPAIFAENRQFGWGLVNCTEEQLCRAALSLADEMLKAAPP